MMKHTAYIILLLLLSDSTFSQSDKQLHQIKPKWKLGDLKRVHSTAFTRIYIKDSLLNNTEVKSYYTIQVIDTVKNYTLSFSNHPGSIEIETKSATGKLDSSINSFTEFIKNIESQTREFKYELLVDKNTGQAFKVRNGDKFLEMVKKVTSTMIDKLGKKKGKTDAQIDSMKQKVIAYFKNVQPKILETTINEFNYLVQPYSYTFAYNSTISQKAMIHDVNALGEFGDVEMPAVLTITSKKQNNSLTINSDTEYDKEFLLAQIKKKYKNKNDLTTSDIFLSEKVETIFQTSNTWIVSHNSNVVFKMKDVKVINETVVQFQ